MAPDRTTHQKPTQLPPYDEKFRRARPPRKGEPGYIPRPLNKWIIFRREFASKTSYDDFQNARAKTTSDSKGAQKVWAELSAEEKRPYELAADEERRRHKEKYPDYKFCPAKKDKAKVATRKHKSEEEEERILPLHPLSDAAPLNELVQGESYESQSGRFVYNALEAESEDPLGHKAENTEVNELPDQLLPFAHRTQLDRTVNSLTPEKSKKPVAASLDDSPRFVHLEPPSRELQLEADGTGRFLYPIQSAHLSLAPESPRPPTFTTDPHPTGESTYAPTSVPRPPSPPFLNDRKFCESVDVSLPTGGYRYQREEPITFSRPSTRDSSLEPTFHAPGPSSGAPYVRGFSHCSLSSEYDMMLPHFRDEDDIFKKPARWDGSPSRSLDMDSDLKPSSPVLRPISLGVFCCSAKYSHRR
ncbi:hypothetical protein E1B28_013133 [Marasmius oreades]|uniref:HMG box domain-containing protein n=1 Tax=Marasmius oreades TaxID=181124 RepID=A0A9P7UMC2_9AGAR|nr:uncharacterized protein E1B28_013133 [Marasmius oreades]KAG7087153.1 hypothetical protein E1B28_013133 [Marasmius oreades]